ncbi:hypothetical protein KBC89_03465 [Candidatus Woesebacteria bacterium]|nr:hypothetical protein [Candidatus Woesebacteria bacterium]
MNKALITFILVTCFVFWPIFNQLDSVATSSTDGPLIAWLTNHAAEFIQGRASLFEPPFFYPFKQTLTFSDPFVSSGFVAVVIQWLLPSITLLEQLNLQFIVGTLGYLLALYWLVKVLGGRGAAAILLAIIGTFIPLRFIYVVHLHTYLIAGIPFGLACLIHYTQGKQWKYLLGFALGYLFQLLNAPMTAYFFIAVIAAYLFSQKQLWRSLIADRRLVITSVVLVVASILFYIPYWQQAEYFNSVRTIRDAAHFSFSINRLFSWDILGLIVLNSLLFATSRKSRSLLLRCLPWLSVSLLGLVLMLGPVVKIDGETVRIFGLPIPLPYFLTYYFVPGMQAFRSVTRWSVVASLGLVLWLAIVIQTSRIKSAVKLGLLAILALLSVVSARKLLPVFSMSVETPAMYLLAAKQPEKIMAMMPMFVWSMVPYEERESVRLLYQPDSQKTYYNGASGFLPPTRAEEIHLHFKSFPNDESISILKHNGVQLLLVEYDQYQKMYEDGYVFGEQKAQDPSVIKIQLEKRDDIQLIQCSYNDCLYRII